jgi:integrase
MARKQLMTWVESKKRWQIWHNKARYKVTLPQLGFPTSAGKLETQIAANEWWEKKLIEIEGVKQATHPHAGALALLAQHQAVASQLGFYEEVESLEETKKVITDLDPDDHSLARHLIVPSQTAGWIWQDRMKRIEKAKETDTAKHHVGLFLAFYESKAKSGEISSTRYFVLRNSTKVFMTFFGETTPIKSISEKTVTGYYAYLEKKLLAGAASNYMKTHWQVFKQLVASVAEDNPEIRIPNNLRSKKYTFAKNRIEPVPFTKEEIDLLLKHSPPKIRTGIMLMLNCGMTQIDVAALQGCDIDWDKGRIITTRSKLRKIKKNAKTAPPKTNWILWDSTFELLKENGNRKGTVLLTAKGTPFVSDTRADGGLSRLDAIKTAYQRLLRKLKNRNLLPKNWHKTLRQFRKTAVNVCQRNKQHWLVLNDLLEHSVAKQHYLVSGEVLPQLDAAVIFAGKELGFVTTKNR